MEGRGTTARYEIRELDPAEFGARLYQLIGVYAAAMRPPADQLAGRHPIMVAHSSYPGFRALIGTADDEVAGFCYGFHGAAGQWWHDRVNYGLAASHGQATAKWWLADTFELAELHVTPACQGLGIGSNLLVNTTNRISERHVVLSTRDTESVARRLYRSFGFTDLLTGFRFDGAAAAGPGQSGAAAGGPGQSSTEPPYAVMGAELPLLDVRPRAASPRRS
jgi:ribosomal protein S18 acetylase RimI-like enzyme